MCAPTTADRGFTWSDDETALLLQLWGDAEAQAELVGNKRNFVVYGRISEAMAVSSFCRTPSQCREKIKRMKREYTLARQQHADGGGPRKGMRFFDQFERILMEKQVRSLQTKTVDVVSKGGTSVADPDSVQGDSSKSFSESGEVTKAFQKEGLETNIPNGLKDAENPWSPDVVLVEEEGPPTLREIHTSSASTSVDGARSSRKRKRKSSSSLIRHLMETLTAKFAKHQTEADAKVLERMEQLEEERAAGEERIRRMWMEFEERRRAEDREHEINVLATFQDIASKVNGAK